MAGISVGINLLTVESDSLLTNLVLWMDCDSSPLVNAVGGLQQVTLVPSFESVRSVTPVSGPLGSYAESEYGGSSNIDDTFTNQINCATGNFTICAWMRWKSNSFVNVAHHTLFPGSNVELRRQGDFIWVYSNNYSDTHIPSTFPQVSSGTNGTWYMITAVFVKTAPNLYTVTMYQNTTLVSTVASFSVDSSGAQKLYSFLGVYSASTAQVNLPGTLYDSVGYWKTALSVNQINKLYNSGSGLVYSSLY